MWLLACALGSAISGLAVPHVTLDAVGDIMLDRYAGDEIVRHGSGYPLAVVRPVLAKADLTVANLECPLTGQPKTLPKTYVFRCPAERVAALAGIDLVTVANNHTLDCGRAGLAETTTVLTSAGIEVCGLSLQPTIVERHGIRIAFLGFSDFPEDAPGSGPGVVYYDRAKIESAVGQARKKADVVVVFAHWGIEGDPFPSERQRREARELAGDGADLILGAHPHVLQPVERIGKTVIAFSMGNFVFDAPNAAQAKTAIFEFRLGKHGVASYRLVPCVIKRTRPVPSSKRDSRDRSDQGRQRQPVQRRPA